MNDMGVLIVYIYEVVIARVQLTWGPDSMIDSHSTHSLIL